MISIRLWQRAPSLLNDLSDTSITPTLMDVIRDKVSEDLPDFFDWQGEPPFE